MGKITVENFGVLNDAKIENQKMTILVGNNSSGKGLMNKLQYCIYCKVREDALNDALNNILK